MKKLCLILVCGAATWLIPPGNAEAIPLFYKTFETKYAGADAKPEFATLVKETKCNVCHVKGEKKEVRNAYGEALHDAGLDKKKYPKERIEAEADAVEKEVMEALEKVAKEKSAGGMTYGDLLKAGKLPGDK
jgi:hypothetical protein